jgi:hypothetical protein
LEFLFLYQKKEIIMDHFKELIATLKKVKSKTDISEDLVTHLLNAAIGAQMTILAKEGAHNPQEAFEITRMICLRELDYVLLEIMDDEDDLDDEDLMEFNPGSPMDDPQLRADIQKAMEAYNDRLKR